MHSSAYQAETDHLVCTERKGLQYLERKGVDDTRDVKKWKNGRKWGGGGGNGMNKLREKGKEKRETEKGKRNGGKEHREKTKR
jgi:hypothetical protein